VSFEDVPANQNELSKSMLSNDIVLQTYYNIDTGRQTDSTKNITTPFVGGNNMKISSEAGDRNYSHVST